MLFAFITKFINLCNNLVFLSIAKMLFLSELVTSKNKINAFKCCDVIQINESS